ncbi:MAG: hypothetical protein AMS16_03320 [Planctomycetes bacterium DG_58]|nr:MAG: hypothetical protein AMS16_03320 [Planctomycetes bacterium DG_58]
MMLGVVNPLLPLFLKSRGLNKAQVGKTWALFSVMALVGPPVWGMISDASRDRRRPLLACVALAAVAFSGYYFCRSLLTLVLMTVVFGMIFKAVIPLGIGLTFAWAEPARKDYSRLRLFGTAGYVVSLVLMSIPRRFFEIEAIFPCFVLFAAAAAVGLHSLPKIPGAGHRKIDWHALKLLGRPAFAVTVVCTFVAQASMAAHYTFFSQYAKADLQVGDGTLMFFWAFGSVFEVVMLTQAGRLIRRFGTKPVLAVGMAGIALRLGIYAALPFKPVVFLVQGLHAFTFGAVHASTVTFVNYAAPTKWRSSAQTIFEGVTIGLGMSFGALVGGQIAQAWSYPVLFGCASAAAALAMVVYAIFGRSVSLIRDADPH